MEVIVLITLMIVLVVLGVVIGAAIIKIGIDEAIHINENTEEKQHGK